MTGFRISRPRVAITDQNPLIRQGLKDLISRDGRFDVTAVAGSGGAFLTLIEEQPIDIAVTGWSLPDLTGGDILSELKRRKSLIRVVVYTGSDNDNILRQSMRLGAWSFVSKSDEPAELLGAIESVAHGRVSFPYVHVKSLLNNPLDEVTERERQLLCALADGLSNSQIAFRFGISRNTVKYHLKNLYEKLGVSNRAMAIVLLLSKSIDKP